MVPLEQILYQDVVLLFTNANQKLKCPNLLQIEQKFLAMSLISSAVFQLILMKSGMDNLSGSESNLAKLEFENSKPLPWKFGKTF